MSHPAMQTLFGTDGIRGTANTDLGAELALDVGRAVAAACGQGVFGTGPRGRPRVVVGRDTRPSGDLLEAALVAGLCSAGADALLLGVLPTPGVAFHTARLGADAGIMISASHNPAADNGLKVIGPGGWKLSEAVEDALEALVGDPGPRPTGSDVGRSLAVGDAVEAYVEHLVSSVEADLAGLRVVVDCANGAASHVAPEVLGRLGVDVEAIHATHDGARINDACGATHPEVVAQAAGRQQAIGLTLDGDADRVLAVDEDGTVVDGDALIAMLAHRLREAGRLSGDAVVSTVMANHALRVWCDREGIRFVETPVGDRYVLEALRDQGLVLGGEQSGHVIRLDRSTTGDGILTGLGLLELVATHGERLADLVPFRPFPQILVNVRTEGRARLPEASGIREAVTAAERDLAGSGRVLVRPSGTEPLVRVMVEARSREAAQEVAERIASVVERELNEGG